jgi:hypothetical protein
MSNSVTKMLSTICFFAGFLSIAASIAIWTLYKSADPAHAERFGIFIGLWAPTFFILSRLLHSRMGVPAAVLSGK